MNGMCRGWVLLRRGGQGWGRGWIIVYVPRGGGGRGGTCRKVGSGCGGEDGGGAGDKQFRGEAVCKKYLL